MEILKNYILPALVWVLVTGIPATITIVKNIKAYRSAKTEAERANAQNAIVAETKRLVAEAEVLYAETNTMLKRNNSSAGGLKKGYVVNALKAFCLEHGYAWTAEGLDTAIEEEVAYTKTVNARNA